MGARAGGRSGPAIKAGSDAHKALFCRQFIETHEVFDPASLPWPDLDEAALARLRGLPRQCAGRARASRRAIQVVARKMTDPPMMVLMPGTSAKMK